MRIIIEMTEAESRSTTVHRETAAPTVPQEAPTRDGGAPPTSLLLALGASVEAPEQALAERGGTDAGPPANWLTGLAAARSGNGKRHRLVL